MSAKAAEGASRAASYVHNHRSNLLAIKMPNANVKIISIYTDIGINGILVSAWQRRQWYIFGGRRMHNNRW